MIWIRVSNTLQNWIRKRLDEGASPESIKNQLIQLIDRELEKGTESD